MIATPADFSPEASETLGFSEKSVRKLFWGSGGFAGLRASAGIAELMILRS